MNRNARNALMLCGGSLFSYRDKCSLTGSDRPDHLVTVFWLLLNRFLRVVRNRFLCVIRNHSQTARREKPSVRTDFTKEVRLESRTLVSERYGTKVGTNFPELPFLIYPGMEGHTPHPMCLTLTNCEGSLLTHNPDNWEVRSINFVSRACLRRHLIMIGCNRMSVRLL